MKAEKALAQIKEVLVGDEDVLDYSIKVDTSRILKETTYSFTVRELMKGDEITE